MNGTKSFFLSKGVLGGLIAFLASVAGLLGFNVTSEDAGLITNNLDAIVAAAGGLLAVWGRVSAKKTIG